MKKRPWLIVVFAFAILISVWTAFIYIAVTNQPEKVSLEKEVVNDGD